MNINKNSQTPIYRQIYNNIVDEIINGYLIPGERLVSRRVLAEKLGIAQRTVETAYNKLAADGYITARRGSGFFVSTDRVWDDVLHEMKSKIYNFSTNGVETSKLPVADWSKLLRATAKENSELFRHGEKAGEWCLRKSIRRMLFRTQGIKCRTEQIIIGPGAEDLLRELVMMLAQESIFLMNNCFYYRVYGVVKELGVKMAFLTNDMNGVHTEELYKYEKGVLYQRPTHDLPTAATLDEEKRREILKWSGEGRYIIEDSDENNYQYGKTAKTLWELSGGKNVIYMGSFSKTIAPSMKIGYIVAPEEIVELWFKKKSFYSNRVSRMEQVTLSKFIDLGYYEKHLDYMRDIYHEKAKVFRTAVANSSLNEYCTITGDDAGMFCVIHCDISTEPIKAKQILSDVGVKLSLLSNSTEDKSRSCFAPNTYVVGYGDMTITQIKEGVAKWAKAWEENL